MEDEWIHDVKGNEEDKGLKFILYRIDIKEELEFEGEQNRFLDKI